MSEELSLVTELAIILVAAGIFTIISKALKQPLILGYIVAGFLVGPHLGLFPQFSENSIHDWSEIGIIFLLFCLGLEFSFKKLIKIGSSAFITAGVKCVGMFVVGIMAGNLMGWTSMESIFLGGLLGMSSTTIIIKAYDDLKLKNRPYATLIFGSLVFEDLIAVLLLVLLSTIAMTGKFAGVAMLTAIAKLVFFLVLCFVVGIYLIPLFLRKVKKHLSSEILLLVSIGLCFAMVVLANLAGFSSALGAFVMGSILAETVEGEHIEHLTGSIKDLFGAIFFVSVGMMLDPAVIVQCWGTILIITVVTMVGIIIFSTTGVLLAGKGLDTAVHAGLSLAQLGEFGFIIASLGCSLGVMRDFIYPVIIAVSVITTFTTPYMIKLGDPVSAWLHRVLPASVLARIDPPQTGEIPSSKAESSEWKTLLGKVSVRVLLYGVIALAVVIFGGRLLPKVYEKLFPDMSAAASNWLSMILILLVSAPFLIGLAVSGKDIREASSSLIHKNSHNVWGVLTLRLLRISVAMAFVFWVISKYFSLSWWAALLIGAAGVGAFFILRRSVRDVLGLEGTFLANFNAREEELRRSTPVSSRVNAAMAGYNVGLKSVTVSPDFSFAGQTLREMPFRKTSGANVIKISRGTRSIVIPSGDEKIFPGDILIAVGTPEQLNSFESTMDENTVHLDENSSDLDFVVQPVVIEPGSYLDGKTLRQANMRPCGCMAVSVLRDSSLHANPHADFLFHEGDTVWLAGERSSVDWFAK